MGGSLFCEIWRPISQQPLNIFQNGFLNQIHILITCLIVSKQTKFIFQTTCLMYTCFPTVDSDAQHAQICVRKCALFRTFKNLEIGMDMSVIPYITTLQVKLLSISLLALHRRPPKWPKWPIFAYRDTVAIRFFEDNSKSKGFRA